MENFQTEVLEIEFTEFSHGFKTISELDFAEVLLRYTDFDRETKKNILNIINYFAEFIEKIKNINLYFAICNY